MDPNDWLEIHSFDPQKLDIAQAVLEEVRLGRDVMAAIKRHPLPGGGYLAKYTLVSAYHQLIENGDWPEEPELLARIRMKPGRSLSGVTTVTVLTQPYPCPGKCIFCPTDARMPKSYLPDEPGAARAFQNDFDPYLQVRSRLDSYLAVGHPTDKIELLILGGTWSSYRREYQEHFVRRCFDAMNEAESASLAEAQARNETAPHRNVGLVIETRPDEITPQELAWLRYLGVTKVQMGAQSLDDNLLQMNQRGHTVADTQRACALLRAAGFKIVLHWMPNLLGATLASDRADFARLWQEAGVDGGLGLCPDEIKIYPTQLLRNADLYDYWKDGKYHPYSTNDLISLIADIKPTIPTYCRVNRVIRDIPSQHVVAGNRRTSLRQDVLAELDRRGQACRCIRCREVRGRTIDPALLKLDDTVYRAACAEEHFLSYVTPDDLVAGYLRLSLPPPGDPQPCAELHPTPGSKLKPAHGWIDFPDLAGAGLIREVHVYGQSLAVGAEQSGAAQHIGLGTALLQKAADLARQHGFHRLAVIAAIGTRRYYEARGFQRRELYMVQEI
jgi:elongator complex protein 3